MCTHDEAAPPRGQADARIGVQPGLHCAHDATASRRGAARGWRTVRGAMRCFTIIRCLAAAAALAAAPVAAQGPRGVAVAPLGAELSEGEVRKVDREASKVTLKHGPIRHLDMPAMTMAFAVRDRAVLDRLRPGDKVRFRAAHEEGRYVAIDIQLVR